MERAGAEVIERTGHDSVVGLPGPKKILDQRAMNRRIVAWMDAHPVKVHVPVDAPAANFPICAAAKARGVKVVHLVAPQVWAWGPWRIKKLRRLTDFVCCLLPFEEPYFRARGVPGAFVGHPLFDEPLDYRVLDEKARVWAQGSPRVALMPGSRPGEIRRNAPLLFESFKALAAERPGLVGVVAAAGEDAEAALRRIAQEMGGWPERLEMAVTQTDAVVRWCDIALVCSGTVSLQIARQRKAMVLVYRASKLLYQLVGRWIVRTPHFTLPNLVAGRRAVPEFVPHFEGHEAITREARKLLDDPAVRAAQVEALEEITGKFRGKNAAVAAADQIERIAGLKPVGAVDGDAVGDGAGEAA